MTTTTSDPALFDMTAGERVAKARKRLEGLRDKAETRLGKAQQQVDQAELELAEFDAAIRAVAAEGTRVDEGDDE